MIRTIACGFHVAEKLYKHDQKRTCQNDLTGRKRFDVVCFARNCQNGTDCEIEDRDPSDAGIQLMMNVLLDTVCVKYNRNRTQHDHDKT